MAYPNPEYEKNLEDRFDEASLVDGYKGIAASQVERLNRDILPFLQERGIVPDEQGKIASTGGVPRIFVMGKTADGNEKPMSLEEAGLKTPPKGKEFWEQVYSGNVFVYPAGQKDPVQLQVDISNYVPELSYSKPVEPEQMPARVMNEPGRIARFFNWISGGRLFKSVTEYDNIQNNAEQRKEALKTMAEKREDHRALEAAAAEATRLEIAAKEHKKMLQDNLKKAEFNLESGKMGYENLSSIFKPVPQKLDRLFYAPPGKGFYTQKEFDSLKVYSKDEIDLSKIILAPSGSVGPKLGRSVSEKDFCAVAMFASKQYENAKDGRILGDMLQAPWDPYAIDELQQIAGFTKKEAEQLDVTQFNSMYTTDLFIVPGSREYSGKYLKVPVNNGRKAAVDAWNEYKNGNKEPLAKIIAFGIKEAERDTVTIVNAPGNEKKGMMQMGAHLLSIMEKDQDLKNLALNNGMTEDQLKTMESVREYLKLDEARNKAEVKLSRAAVGGPEHELSTEEKTACMKDIVKASLVEQIWVSENLSADTEKMQELDQKMLDPDNLEMMPDNHIAWNKDPYKRPAPPQGKFWSDTGFGMVRYAKDLIQPTAPVLGKLSDPELDKIVEKIVAEDKVETLNCEQLSTRYASKGTLVSKLKERSIKIVDELKAEQKAPGAQPELQAGDKQIINNEIQQPEGIQAGPVA